MHLVNCALLLDVSPVVLWIPGQLVLWEDHKSSEAPPTTSACYRTWCALLNAARARKVT